MVNVTTLAADTIPGFADLTGCAARIKYPSGVNIISLEKILSPTKTCKYPSGIAIDASGNIYVADRNNNRIRKLE